MRLSLKGEILFGTTMEPVLAPVSLATDINGNALKATAALRIGMHHLHGHAERFAPANNGNYYMHCVSQACQTFPVHDLTSKLLHTKESVMLGDLEIEVTPLISESWVQSLGRTSITFGHAVCLDNDLLALATKVMVRQGNDGKLIHISDDERNDQFPASYEELELPSADKPVTPNLQDMEEIFNVRIGPQHCNDRYCDPASLADMALQGMCVKGIKQFCQKVSFQHFKPAQMHETLSCRISKDHSLVGLYRECHAGEPDLLVLAKMEAN